jgi:hypothetical protein
MFLDDEAYRLRLLSHLSTLFAEQLSLTRAGGSG